MKFIQYINEKNLGQFSAQDIVDKLRSDCKIILKWMERFDYDKCLRRFNRKRMGTRFDLIVPRTDRKPQDTPDWVQKIIDDAFEKKYGVRPRSTGVFCKMMQVHDFTFPMSSDLFVLFPVGKYTGIWSENISDLYLKWTTDISDVSSKKTIRKDTKTWAFGPMLDEYNEGSLEKVVYYQEIMLVCKKYYAVDGTTYEQVYKLLKQ